MKKIVVLLLLITISCGLLAINIKEKIALVPAVNYPFDCTKTAPRITPIYGFSDEESQDLPLYNYDDLGLTQKTKYKNSVRILRKFRVDNGTFDLLALNIGDSDPQKELVATFNKDGQVIDFIETGIYFITSARMYVKQWRIDSNMHVIVTHLKVTSPVPILFYNDFDTVEAQRIDTYYEIDSVGKFHELRQVKYQPRTYTQSYLMDKTKNLWEGGEVVLK